MLRGFDLIELQADELCTFVGNKNETVWLFATLEVSSRLWAGSVLGRRSDQNARAVIKGMLTAPPQPEASKRPDLQDWLNADLDPI